MVCMVIHFPNRHDNHWADDDRTVMIMDMIDVPMWIWWVMGIPTETEAKMQAVPVMVPMVPTIVSVMADMVLMPSVVLVMAPVEARGVSTRLGPVSRVALDVRSRSRQ